MGVIQSLDGLFDDSLQILPGVNQRFMKPDEIGEKNNDKSVIARKSIGRIGSLEGQNLIDIDVCYKKEFTLWR